MGYRDKPYAELDSEIADYLASVDSEERKSIPIELAWFLQCERYQCLLVAGGLLDQPDPLWSFVQYAGALYHTWENQRIEEAIKEAEKAISKPNSPVYDSAVERAKQDAQKVLAAYGAPSIR